MASIIHGYAAPSGVWQSKFKSEKLGMVVTSHAWRYFIAKGNIIEGIEAKE